MDALNHLIKYDNTGYLTEDSYKNLINMPLEILCAEENFREIYSEIKDYEEQKDVDLFAVKYFNYLLESYGIEKDKYNINWSKGELDSADCDLGCWTTGYGFLLYINGTEYTDLNPKAGCCSSTNYDLEDLVVYIKLITAQLEGH